MKKKQASSTIYMIFFFIVFLAFCGFAVDGAIVFTNRAKLQSATESTALAAASEFNSKTNLLVSDITTAASNAFNLIKPDSLKYATISSEVNLLQKEVRVTTQCISQPFFLSFLGVSGIKLQAKACAKSEQLFATANYPGINWITKGAAYLSDVISKDLNLNDTAILKPLGEFSPPSSYDTLGGAIFFDALNKDYALSLGPGGFITIKLPAPIINKTGYDLFIKEAGDSLDGYMVFAGIDNDPDNPYVQNGTPGAGISWINITSSGKAEISDSNGDDFKDTVSTDGIDVQDRFYGSGYFDIGAKNLAMVKYIRIVDDNEESAYVTTDKSAATTKPFYKANVYGEASTATAGADIDAVTVLNHVKLISPSAYTP